MKKVYNKLIRDKIPEIIKSAGEIPKVEILKSDEFKKSLLDKVVEESKELLLAKNKDEIINELVDIEELLFWIKKEFKIDQKEIDNFRNEKNKKRGSFKKKLFLIETKK